MILYHQINISMKQIVRLYIDIWLTWACLSPATPGNHNQLSKSRQQCNQFKCMCIGWLLKWVCASAVNHFDLCIRWPFILWRCFFMTEFICQPLTKVSFYAHFWMLIMMKKKIQHRRRFYVWHLIFTLNKNLTGVWE